MRQLGCDREVVGEGRVEVCLSGGQGGQGVWCSLVQGACWCFSLPQQKRSDGLGRISYSDWMRNLLWSGSAQEIFLQLDPIRSKHSVASFPPPGWHAPLLQHPSLSPSPHLEANWGKLSDHWSPYAEAPPSHG